MANINKRVSDNVEGLYYVDSTCINCGVSRHYAPTVFGDNGNCAYVLKQPQNPAETLATQQALLACPVAAIGTTAKIDLQSAVNSFPIHLDGPVFINGFNHRDSYGAHSYFIRTDNGNWLIDSPRFTAHLVEKFMRMGGLDYIFLTHCDDVSDASKYARHFKAKRIIHKLDSHAQRDAEIILDGETDHHYSQARIVFTPGHTRGHLVLLWEDKYLFTGDHFAWLADAERFGSFRDACWYSWGVQIQSVAKLRDFTQVQWVLPGHGKWGQITQGQFGQIIESAVETMKNQI